MPKFKHIEDLMNPSTHPMCYHPDCGGVGEHRAPLSRENNRDYQWLCTEHIKSFNKQWDYFQGMSQDQIEAFQKDAAYGHRPTWKINEADKHRAQKLNEAFGRFMDGEFVTQSFVPPVNMKDKQALADLDLEHPCEIDEIKLRYKKLVKQYHPDRNPDNKKAEERFKQITASYHHLIQHYCEQPA